MMKHGISIRIGAGCILPLALVVAGCGKKSQAEADEQPASRIDKVKDGARDAVATTKDFIVEQKERLQKSFSEKMSEFDKQLEELKGKSTAATEKTKGELARTLADLQKKKDAAAQKLEQLKSSSSQAWQDIKAGAEKVFADAEQAFKEAVGRFKSESDSK